MKSFKLSFMAVVACMMLLTVTAQANVTKQNRLLQNTAMKMTTPEIRKYSSTWGVANQSKALRAKQAANPELGIPSDTIISKGFGFLQGPDGLDWIFTDNPTWGGEFGDEIKKSIFTIYDASRNIVATITHIVDENKWVNDVYPFGMVTTNFFDNNSSTFEVLVFEHEVLAPGVNVGKIYVYNTNGEKITEYDAEQLAIYRVQKTSQDLYERMLLVSNPVEHEGEYVRKIDICKRKSDGGIPEVEHTLIVAEDKINAIVGAYFNTYEIDNKPYYVISQYEKPFFTGEWDYNTGDQLQTQDNSFIVTVYDEKFNVVEEISVPCEKPKNIWASYGFGSFSDKDLSKGLYTNNDEFNFVITIGKMYLMEDKDRFTFDVYDSNGQKVKAIDTDVDAEGIMQLSDVAGYETQWAFGHTETNEEDETTSFIRLVNIPSCQVAATITPTVDLPISFEMNRVAKGDGYQYVTSFRDAEFDEDDNVYAIVGWFNSDFTLDRKVKFNLGQHGLMAKFNFTPAALNPLTFDGDNDLEYLYLSNVERADGSNKNDTYLNIADHEGKTIRSYVGNDTKGEIIRTGFLNIDTQYSTLCVIFRDARDKYTLEFVNLPLDAVDTAIDNMEAGQTNTNIYKALENGTLYIIRTNAATGVEERFMIDGRRVK